MAVLTHTEDWAPALHGDKRDIDAIVQRVAGARLVLLGEASHGTEEFYAMRAAITRRLIAEHGYDGVVAEADWPDAWRVHLHVTGRGGDASAHEALGGFLRFPRWMWRNHQTVKFVDWLRVHNANHRGDRPAGFYGMDLYSMFGSIDAVIRYLDGVDHDAATAARRRYSCFDHFGRDEQAYGYATGLRSLESCESDVVAQLVESARHYERVMTGDGAPDVEHSFSAHQNARLIRDAERYYRLMHRGRESTWNLRDTHMAETLEELLEHLDERDGGRRRARLVVWAHNSHLGDARATQMGGRGEHNVGQLVRERHGLDCALVGFSTYEGTVRAAHDWDEPGEVMRVVPGLDGSYEHHFHELGGDRLVIPGDAPLDELPERRLQRAIGVLYRPATERFSHYFHTRLRSQFDLLVHVDRTTALVPIDRPGFGEHGSEPPESWPTGY